MTSAQVTYLVAIGIYVLFFVLFMRYFWWKRYSENNFWKRRPDLSVQTIKDLALAKAASIPFVSILVPARNEADVIERTIDHLATMQYPKDRYEIVVVTDDKELMARDEARPRAIEAAVRYVADPT
ncbi:MAG: glycosyltransferase, partial [Chloroflexota bacterium]